MNLIQDTSQTLAVIRAGANQEEAPTLLQFQDLDEKIRAEVYTDGQDATVFEPIAGDGHRVQYRSDGLASIKPDFSGNAPFQIAASELKITGISTGSAPSGSPTYIKVTINGVEGVIQFYPL